MTETEHEAMVEAGNRFWVEFSALCDKYIAEAPKHLESEYLMYLSEKTSVYGRKVS